MAGFRKSYTIRKPMPDRDSAEVTFPWDVVERAARSRGISISEFLSSYDVVAEYGDEEIVRYTFEKKNKN